MYRVSITVIKEFQSEKDAVEFSDKVLESTKGEAEYDRTIKYYKPKTLASAITYNNYTVSNPASDAHLKKMGLDKT